MPFLSDRLTEMQYQQTLSAALKAEDAAAPRSSRMDQSALALLSSRFTFDLAVIERELRSNIVGQDAMIASVMRVLTVIRADIADPRRPLASILFAGPTGVGKTETVRILARALRGDAEAFCRVDMNTLSQGHYVASLSGAPPGYVGSKEGMTILDQDKIEGSLGCPGIVLFDELEKASDEVALALLNVLDNGILTVASGERTYSFRNTIIFLTTNLGAKDIQRNSRKPAKTTPRKLHVEPSKIVLDKLLKRFPPEFVNRIDLIETLNSIGPDALEGIIHIEIGKLNRRLAKHGCQLAVSVDVVKHLTELGFDHRFGARGMHRMIRKHIEFPLAQFLLANTPVNDRTEASIISADLQNNALKFTVCEGSLHAT